MSRASLKLGLSEALETGFGSEVSRRNKRKEEAMKFEYHMETFDNSLVRISSKGRKDGFIETMNALGQDGWELVGITSNTMVLGETRAITLVFKRKLQ